MMIDRLFSNMIAAANIAGHGSHAAGSQYTDYVMRKYQALTNFRRDRRAAWGGQGSKFSRMRKGRAEAAKYDREHKLSDAYYGRDASSWAGR